MIQPLLIAKGKGDFYLLPKMINRHGLIAGATGTGKTVTLQKMAESLSAIGVPVFMADIKGDLSGVSQQGSDNPKVAERIKKLKITDFTPQAYPVAFWDVLQAQGHPIRATVSDMGPLLFGRILNLNEVQTGVLTVIFKIADDQGLLLLDLKDLQAMCQLVGDHAAEFTTKYGNISKASVGAIQRGLIELTTQKGEQFFGEPMLDVYDLIQVDAQGKGMINVLAADQLIRRPKTYAVFLLWLLSELFEKLPEVGDLEKPKMVFFFDEAHLLFEDVPEALLEQIEQVVRLIRSKGVGIYFVTQNPSDIPDKVLAQLGNRVQHALRAFTPQDQKAIKAMAQTFRTNSKLNVEDVMTQLEVGEALVSFLDENGSPAIVERAFICPPQARIGTVTPQERQVLIQSSVHFGNYEKTLDRESAYELITKQAQAQVQPSASTSAPARTRVEPNPAQDMLGAMAKSALRAVGSQVGRQIARGLLGSILGGRGRRSFF